MVNNVQDELLSAYRTSFCTEAALIKITDKIHQAFDSKSSTAMKVVDMCSAYYTVDHVLPHRLCSAGQTEQLECFQIVLM